jgi:hypothetical protein
MQKFWWYLCSEGSDVFYGSVFQAAQFFKRDFEAYLPSSLVKEGEAGYWESQFKSWELKCLKLDGSTEVFTYFGIRPWDSIDPNTKNLAEQVVYVVGKIKSQVMEASQSKQELTFPMAEILIKHLKEVA